jgi:hypothetical protein
MVVVSTDFKASNTLVLLLWSNRGVGWFVVVRPASAGLKVVTQVLLPVQQLQQYWLRQGFTLLHFASLCFALLRFASLCSSTVFHYY